MGGDRCPCPASDLDQINRIRHVAFGFGGKTWSASSPAAAHLSRPFLERTFPGPEAVDEVSASIMRRLCATRRNASGFAQFLAFSQDAADRTFLRRASFRCRSWPRWRSYIRPMIGRGDAVCADNVEDVIIPDCGHWITENSRPRRQTCRRLPALPFVSQLRSAVKPDDEETTAMKDQVTQQQDYSDTSDPALARYWRVTMTTRRSTSSVRRCFRK